MRGLTDGEQQDDPLMTTQTWMCVYVWKMSKLFNQSIWKTSDTANNEAMHRASATLENFENEILNVWFDQLIWLSGCDFSCQKKIA